ncbi:DUF4349 domain-containing protein [Allosalinactinospora lopnorensis]|uniref:DUF4349 domain-containing protein n=1 Tax=Allosalinactinospora lopnorensis TaxID=1352348 RepID=UPI000696BDBF|nr:DUF4349 domain-containing protein [Allosalinactinospora lopnorensis]
MDISAPPRGTSRLIAAAVTPILAALLLAGCSSTSEQQAVSDADGAAPERDTAAENGPAAPEAEGGADGDAGGDAAVAGSEVDARERAVVHTAELTVEVTEVEAAADDAKEWVGDAGGHVAAENIGTETGEGPRASLTLKIPADRYEEALDDLGDLGTQADLQRKVDDVTEEVADVDSRVESAEATLDRLRELLDEADSVEDVLAVESEISNRQQELEALQARQQALQDSTTFGTVNLSLLPPDSYLAEQESDSIGFTGGLVRGWRALATAAQGLAVVAGWTLPFLGVAAVAGAPVVLWLRRRVSGRPAPAAEPVAAGDGGTGTDSADGGDDQPPSRED